MPEIFKGTKFWLRQGKQSPTQNKHMDMSKEARENALHCKGIKQSHPCKNPVYKCSHCGNYGCSQIVLEKCSRQGFKNDTCLSCGTQGHIIPVPEAEMDAYQKFWQEKETE